MVTLLLPLDEFFTVGFRLLLRLLFSLRQFFVGESRAVAQVGGPLHGDVGRGGPLSLEDRDRPRRSWAASRLS